VRGKIAAGLLGLVIGLMVWLLPVRRFMPEPHLPVPERLSAIARAALSERMSDHRILMDRLIDQVVLLDFDQVRATADRILRVPRLARPIEGDATELNSLLPDRFFVLDQELATRCQALRGAAAAHDAAALGGAFGHVAATCVACHESYLTGR
jgi:hypothetical protein